MSRFEKKCFIGSAALHGLLLVVFLFGSAFIGSKAPKELPPVITVFDSKVTDKLIASGGKPDAAPPAPQKIEQPAPQPPPPPPEPKPEKAEVKPKPEVIKPKPEVVKDPPKSKTPDKTAVPQRDKKELTKHSPTNEPSILTHLKPVKADTARLQREAAQREAQAKADREAWEKYNAQRSQFSKQVGSVIDGVSKNISHETVATAVGPGGAAFVNYGSLIIEKYRAAVYASHPQSDVDAEAVIRVVISRDGTVRSSQWVKRTGNSVLDKAVDRAMNSVRSLPEFPSETKDTERTFNITIAFDAKRFSA
jgi:TonB family protein